MKTFLVITLVTGLLGCTHHGSSAVDFSKSGGYTGSTTHLVIDTKGHARVVADPGGKRKFTLTVKQRHKLASLLEAARDAGAPGMEGGCADCFVYTITADGLAVRYDDSSTVPGPVSALTGYLTKLAG